MSFKKKGKILVVFIAVALLSVLLLFCFLDSNKGSIYQQAKDYVYTRYVLPVPPARGFSRFHVNCPYKGEQILISHAATSGMQAPPNSEEGFRMSAECGFRYIELDLLETTDGHIIAAHDWGILKEQAGWAVNQEPLSMQEIMNIKKEGRANPLCAKEICKLLEQYPDIVLVTDKICNFELLLKEIPFPERMIVEVPGLKMYEAAIYAGIKYPALFLPDEPIIYDAVLARHVPIVTVGKDVMLSPNGFDRLHRLHEEGIVIMLFFSQMEDKENEQFVKEHVGKEFSMIYTDAWSPRSWDNTPADK